MYQLAYPIDFGYLSTAHAMTVTSVRRPRCVRSSAAQTLVRTAAQDGVNCNCSMSIIFAA